MTPLPTTQSSRSNGYDLGQYSPPDSTVLDCDPQCEESVLGAMLLEPTFCSQVFTEHSIDAEDFSTLRNRQVFLTMREVWAAGIDVDLSTLYEPLINLGWTIAETSALIDLPTRVVSVLHAPNYIHRLKQLTKKRKFAKLASESLNNDDPFAHFFGEARGIELVETPQADTDSFSPLDVTSSPKLDLGWIDSYARLMTALTGSPFEFNRLCGLCGAAVTLQRRAVLRMSFGDVHPNIYGAIVAPSSVYHKSSSLARLRALLQLGRLEHLIMSELGTSEGILKQLSERNCGLIIRDEFGTMLSSHNVKHLSSLKPDLTALYDCYPYSRRLSHESIKVEAPYLNILGATTPARFFDSVSLTDWTDGFMARWLIVLPEGEPDFDAETLPLSSNHNAALHNVAETLVHLDRERETDFMFGDGAHRLWDIWQSQARRAAYSYGDEIASAVVTRYSAYALKFAMILAAVNGSWGRIDRTTMETAIFLADNYKAIMNRLLVEKGNYGVSGAKLQKIHRTIVKQNKGAGVTRRTIVQYTNLSTHEVAQCLEKLLEVGAITEDSHGRTKYYTATATELPIKSWK